MTHLLSSQFAWLLFIEQQQHFDDSHFARAAVHAQMWH